MDLLTDVDEGDENVFENDLARNLWKSARIDGPPLARIAKMNGVIEFKSGHVDIVERHFENI